MAKAATITLKSLLESGEYEVLPNAPIFDEHDEYDADGNLLRRFSRDDLQEICDVNNARNDRGDLTLLGIGHTIPRDPVTREPVPENKQPVDVGYVVNYKVGERNGVPVIMPDLLIHKAKLAELKDPKTGQLTYKRRSIELRPSDKVIDWVALLRKAPARDLGLLSYSFETKQFTSFTPMTTYYRDAAKTKPLAMAVRGQKVFYSMDWDESKHPRDHGKFATSPGTAGSEGLSGEERERRIAASADAQKKAYAEMMAKFGIKEDAAKKVSDIAEKAVATATPEQKTTNFLGYLSGVINDVLAVVLGHRPGGGPKYYSLEDNDMAMDPTKPADAAAPNDEFTGKIERYMAEKYPNLGRMHDECTQRYDAEQAAAAEPPKPGPGAPAAGNTAIPGVEGKKKPEEEDKLRLERQDDAIRYARIERELAELKAAREIDHKTAVRAKATQRVQALRYAGYNLDTATEVARYEATAEAEWDKLDDHIRRYYRQDGPGMIPVGGMFETEVPGPSGESMTREEQQEIIRYAAKEGIADFHEAKKRYRSKAS